MAALESAMPKAKAKASGKANVMSAEALLAAAYEEPTADDPRLVYGDWLLPERCLCEELQSTLDGETVATSWLARIPHLGLDRRGKLEAWLPALKNESFAIRNQDCWL